MASDERLKYLLEELETQATKVESHVKEIKSLLPNSTDNFKQQFDKISDKIKYTLTNNNTVDYSTGRELAKYDIKSNNAQVANSLTGKGIASKYNISNAGPTSSFKPTLTADQVKANFERVQWYPQTFKQFIKHPFDVKKGVDINDVIANIGTIVKFHPQSLFIQIWNSLYSIGIIIYIMLMPLGICYINFQEWSPALTVYITSLIVVKTVVTVNTGIIADQELEMDRSIVWRHLWKQTYLLKQLLIGFPYSLLIDLIAPPGSMSRFVWRALSLINGLSIVQLLQSTDVSYLSEKATQIIRKREINPTMVKFVYILVAIIFYWHYFSCAITFANVTGFIPDPIVKSNFYDHYVFNFYNSASLMFTAGFGVNGPVENQDRWSKILNMIFSAFLLSLFTANITTYMIRLDSSGRQFNEKLEEVNQYIQYRGLGRGLQERIIQYYHFKYSKGKYFDEDKILAELNHPLRVSICMKECRGLILQVPFFRDASHSFLTQVVTILEICHFLADDVIIEEGTVGDQMFFISSGIVEVLIGEKPVKRLNEGEYFGEISLLFGNMNRTASIKAITDCVLFSVVVSDFKEIVEDFPEILNQMKIVAEARLKENKIGVKLTGNRTAVLVDRSYEALNEEFEQKPLQKASDKLHRSIEDLKDNSAVLPLIKSEYIHSNIVVINQNNENLEAFPSTDGNVIDIEKRKEETTPKSPIIFESNLDQVFNDRKLKNSASDFINLNFLDKHISDPTSPPNNNTNDPTAISSSEVPNDNEVRRRAEDSIMSDNTQKNAEFRIERPVGRGESIKPRNRGGNIE
ncbi:hypothetical protein BC833DRAFT_328145 [Globomyces pollinis-pini]|nr:hypothetical protein BC833DRAFT_328145 [Globomyces pollinis-pini]